MGHFYDSRDKAIAHTVTKGENLAGIADQYKGKDDVPHDLDWKKIALYNWATAKAKEVTRALCERVGSSVPDAVSQGKSPEGLTLDPDFGPSSPEKILVPKLWKKQGLSLDKRYTIKTQSHTPASAVGIRKLDKWFIPGHETCDVDYGLMGDPAFADAVTFEVYASNYGKLKAWNDGLPEFEPLPDVPVYSGSAEGGTIRNWKGLSKCSEGALSPDGHPLNVAFSPYTVVLRYAKEDAHGDARIDLDPFWVQFDDEDEPKTPCKVGWTVKNAEVKLGLLQIADGEGNVIYAKGLNESDLKGKKFEWDGTEANGELVTRDKMPFRVQIQAHTEIDTKDGLALAAMHTEVRLYAHKETYPESKDPYDPLTDAVSLDFSVADVYHKDEPLERSDGSLWTKYKLAEAGFHPGPVIDGSSNDHFESAVRELRRSVPKGGGKRSGSAPFVRMDFKGGDNDDTKDALEHLEERRKRPWFGKPAESGETIELKWRPENWDDVTTGDFLGRLRDPTKRMIIWVDDRNWYTDGKYWKHGFYDLMEVVSDANLDAFHDNPADLGGAEDKGRGSFEDRDKRVEKDERDVARPWIPLQVGFRLLGKGDELDSEIATPNVGMTELMRKAIGPIRVDWTFDEIEKTSPVSGVKQKNKDVTDELPELDTECDQIFSQLYHPTSVRTDYSRPVAMRTRMALRWALNELKAEYDRKDVKRKSKYFNAPEKHGGIRPDGDPSGKYFKVAFGLDGESLLPWTTKPDTARESVCTAVHDDVGQGEDDLFDKRIGRAGIYLHPSRMAGDGYQVRAQARFETEGPFVFPNAEVLGQRYERLPQAHTVQFRLWRKTSIRGYVPWAPAGNWESEGDSSFDHMPKTGADQWRSHYTACHVSIENELGASIKELVQESTTLFPDEGKYKDLIAGMLKTGDPRKDTANFGWMSLRRKYVWPWSRHDLYGVTKPVVESDLRHAYTALYKKLNCDHVTIAIRLSMAMVNALEEQTGRMRGHVLVQYQTTKSCYFVFYHCATCNNVQAYVQKSAADLNPECASHGCTLKLTKDRAIPYVYNRGSKSAPGVPSPSCGFPGGVFWNVVGDATLWGHELGHNRHYEHSADAPQIGASPQQPGFTARPEHDNAENPYLIKDIDEDIKEALKKSIIIGPEKDENKGWDRACLMSYVTQKKTFKPARDLCSFCFKCALKNRGWKVAGLPTPEGDLQDVAGV